MFIDIAKTLSPLHPELSLMTYMGPMTYEPYIHDNIRRIRNTDIASTEHRF